MTTITIIFSTILYGVGDEHGIDDDEMNSVRLPHRHSINAYYGHEDMMKSHIYDTYLSAKAVVRERDRSEVQKENRRARSWSRIGGRKRR